MTPLIPSYVEKYSLSDFYGGLVLSIASLGILVVSLPAGWVTKYVTPRALTLSAMLVIAIAHLVSGYFFQTASAEDAAATPAYINPINTMWTLVAVLDHDPRSRLMPPVPVRSPCVPKVSELPGPIGCPLTSVTSQVVPRS